MEYMETKQPDGGTTMKDYPIPLGGNEEGVLRIPQPMTAKMFATLKRVINLYEDIMVSDEDKNAAKE